MPARTLPRLTIPAPAVPPDLVLPSNRETGDVNEYDSALAETLACLRDLKRCLNLTLRMEAKPRFARVADAARWVLVRDLTRKHVRAVREMEAAFGAFASYVIEDLADILLEEKECH